MTYNSELGPGNFSDQFFFELDENYNFITKMSTNFDQKGVFINYFASSFRVSENY